MNKKLFLFVLLSLFLIFKANDKVVNEPILLCILLIEKNPALFENKFFATISRQKNPSLHQLANFWPKFMANSFLHCTNRLKFFDEKTMVRKFSDLISVSPIIEASYYLFAKQFLIDDFSAILSNEEKDILLAVQKQKLVPKVI